MSSSSDQNPSSLDPEVLRELEAAEAGESSPLLNDTPVLDRDPDEDKPPAASPGAAEEVGGVADVSGAPEHHDAPETVTDQASEAPAPGEPAGESAGSKADPPPEPPDDLPLNQSDLDVLLAESGVADGLSSDQLAPPADPPAGEDEDDMSLSQSSIDSLMADLGDAGEAAPEPGSDAPDDAGDAAEAGGGEEEEDSGDISQDMIEALIASARSEVSGGTSESAESEVGSENLAAAATAPEAGSDALSPSDLDKLIEESRREDPDRDPAEQQALDEAIAAATAAAPESGDWPDDEAAAKSSRRFRKPGVVWPFIKQHYARIAVSLLVGLAASIWTAGLLWAHREAVPRSADARAATELQVAMDRARDHMSRADYTTAIHELEGPVANARPGALLNDARYLLLEARYRAFRGKWGTEAFDTMTARIDELVGQSPNHSRAPEALYWKAQLFAGELPQVALDTYADIFEQYATAAGMDKMLLDAAHLARERNAPLKSAIYAQDLLRRFPGSPWAGEAILAIGDANVIAGNTADARATFVRMAESEPDSRLGAEAYLRLGRLDYETGQYDRAIAQLTRRLETTTTTAGNDEVYLLLARAQRQAGDLQAARDTLSDLLNIFAPSHATPDAYIEYSQVLEELGERDNAVKVAKRAAAEYPGDPDVLRNHGAFQGLDGNPQAAADALVAADRAGAGDPGLLLTAARYYHTADMPAEARDTYNRLKNYYAGTPASLAGGIEAAELKYAQGEAENAINELEALQAATRGTEHYLAAVQAMLGIYQDLGLTDRVQALAGEVARLADEPETVARAAMDLLDAGDLEQAQNALETIDLARLRPRTAFDLLMKQGRALLPVAPRRGLEKMEEAHFNYPEARTRQADQDLLETYLATGRPAAARRLVMDVKAGADENPVDVPYLVDAAVAWGDYLYGREDYRTAVFAYTLAEEAGGDDPAPGFRASPEWARYQRANALLRLADYNSCLPLFEAIAASDSPWAGEAAVKADVARIEQRQRGIPVAAAQPG